MTDFDAEEAETFDDGEQRDTLVELADGRRIYLLGDTRDELGHHAPPFFAAACAALLRLPSGERPPAIIMLR